MEEAGVAPSQASEHIAEFKDVLASGFVQDKDSNKKEEKGNKTGHKGADTIRLMVDRQENEEGDCSLSPSSVKPAFCSNV